MCFFDNLQKVFTRIKFHHVFAVSTKVAKQRTRRNDQTIFKALLVLSLPMERIYNIYYEILFPVHHKNESSFSTDLKLAFRFVRRMALLFTK